MPRKLIVVALVAILGAVLVVPVVGGRISAMFATTAAQLESGSSRGGGPALGDRSSSVPAAPPAPGAPAEARARDAAGSAAGATTCQTLAQPLPSLDRMIVRNLSLTLLVPNVVDAYRQIEGIVAAQGGYVSGAQVRQDGERATATVTVRVPAEGTSYRTALDQIRALADRVVEEQGQAQDVTEDHVDLEARVRTLRMTEDSLRTLYNRAQRIEDVYAVQRELTTIRGQIEQAEGRKLALERKAALATITLQLRETASLAPRPRDWSPSEVVAEAFNALSVVLRGATTVAIWLAVWLPLYAVPLLALWLLRRRLPGVAR